MSTQKERAERDARIWQLYQEGVFPSHICFRLCVSIDMVRNVLKNHGVAATPPHVLTEKEEQDFLLEYQSGKKSIEELAYGKYGCTQLALWKCLRKHPEIPRRKPYYRKK